jgi:hypothetical protein
MSRRGARLAVAVLFALSIGAAAWQYAGAERAQGSRQSLAADFERGARALALGIAELRAEQQAYVATGQGAEYWTARVTGSIASLSARTGSLRQLAESAEAATRLEGAAASLDDFARMDRRAREYATSGQRLLASDLIFAEGLELTRAAALDVDGARVVELAHRARAAAAIRNRQHALAGGIAALGLFFMLILAFASRGAAERGIGRTVHQPLPETPLASRMLALDADPPAPAPPPAAQTPPPVDLTLAADLCVELARVTDTDQIPSLLDRAAQVLDASGIVLWIADPDGRELVPTVAHGYPAAAISRVGAISRDADNATAAAFREVKVRVVRADVMTGGAIVAPLVTPAGCVGVMAAEVRHDREQSEEVRAIAAIIASQLATLIGIAPAAAQAKATAN